VVRSSSARVSRPIPISRLLYEFPWCHSRVSLPILLKAIVDSLLLEDFSSVKKLEAGFVWRVVEVYDFVRWKSEPKCGKTPRKNASDSLSRTVTDRPGYF